MTAMFKTGRQEERTWDKGKGERLRLNNHEVLEILNKITVCKRGQSQLKDVSRFMERIRGL